MDVDQFVLPHPLVKKWPALHPRQADKDGCLVSQFSPTFKSPGAQRCDIRREPHTQQVDVMNNSRSMPETQNVAFTRTAGQQRFYCVFHSAVGKVTQK